ncbi:MAG: hypothetical protein ACKN9T_13105, partial [Candidatus Methylumidiphilus sp.]
QINRVGNPRAKGQVEGFHNIIERQFESALKLMPMRSLDELNAAARRWNVWFNATKLHSRHGKTRNAVWLTIHEDKLRIPPPADICRELCRTAPEERQVRPDVAVSFGGAFYDVRHVPDLNVGQKVLVCTNPWRPDTVQVIALDSDGNEVYHVCERKLMDENGFYEDAVVIGERYRAPKDTPAVKAGKRLEVLATGQDTEEGQKKARKAAVVPFGGRIDPMKHQDAAQVPTCLPKRGTEMSAPKPRVELPKLPTTELAARLMKAMGKAWKPEFFPRLREWFPGGAAEDEIPDIAERLLRGEEHRAHTALRVVK